MYLQLQMIIYKSSVLHTCTQTLFHTRHSPKMQETFRRAHNNKRQYFIEPFLIRSMTIVSLQSTCLFRLISAVMFFFFVWQW